jgi:hypothetical protein
MNLWRLELTTHYRGLSCGEIKMTFIYKTGHG